MILDLEAIELKKLANIITEKKGIIIDLSTDCVSAIFPDNTQPFELDGVNLAEYYYDTNMEVPCYKIEEK